MTSNTTLSKIIPSAIGNKDDKGKCRLDLVEPEFIEGVGDVLTYGANKYGANNWQQVDDAKNRYFAACLRHLFAYRKGEKEDSESKFSHLFHAACNLMFLAHFERETK